MERECHLPPEGQGQGWSVPRPKAPLFLAYTGWAVVCHTVVEAAAIVAAYLHHVVEHSNSVLDRVDAAAGDIPVDGTSVILMPIFLAMYSTSTSKPKPSITCRPKISWLLPGKRLETALGILQPWMPSPSPAD